LGVLQFNGGSSLGLTFLGESQVVNGMQGSSFIFLNDGIYLRAYGTFPHPNVLGGFYILMFVIGWISSLKLKRSWKYLSYLLMFLSLIFVLFTFSRISISLVLLGVLLFSIQFIKPNRIFSFSPILIFERFMNLFAGGDTSFNDRVNLFKAGISVFKENMFLGTGIGNFIKYMGESAPRTSNGILLLQPIHHVFLLSFIELGLFGGVVYWWILLKLLIKEVNWKENIWIKIFILIALVVIEMFDHYLFTLPQGMVIWIFMILGLFL
jgi:O-antigen ligase